MSGVPHSLHVLAHYTNLLKLGDSLLVWSVGRLRNKLDDPDCVLTVQIIQPCLVSR